MWHLRPRASGERGAGLTDSMIPKVSSNLNDSTIPRFDRTELRRKSTEEATKHRCSRRIPSPWGHLELPEAAPSPRDKYVWPYLQTQPTQSALIRAGICLLLMDFCHWEGKQTACQCLTHMDPPALSLGFIWGSQNCLITSDGFYFHLPTSPVTKREPGIHRARPSSRGFLSHPSIWK